MWKRFLRTESELSSTILRVLLGVVMFPHGAGKVFEVFGGGGFSNTMDHFTQRLGIPWALALLAIAAEFLGSIGLVFGFLTRLCALGIGTVMVVAAVEVHWQNGFFMNWRGNQSGEGIEYHVLALAISIALLLRGGGAASIDRSLSARMR